MKRSACLGRRRFFARKHESGHSNGGAGPSAARQRNHGLQAIVIKKLLLKGGVFTGRPEQ